MTRFYFYYSLTVDFLIGIWLLFNDSFSKGGDGRKKWNKKMLMNYRFRNVEALPSTTFCQKTHRTSETELRCECKNTWNAWEMRVEKNREEKKIRLIDLNAIFFSCMQQYHSSRDMLPYSQRMCDSFFLCLFVQRCYRNRILQDCNRKWCKITCLEC